MPIPSSATRTSRLRPVVRADTLMWPPGRRELQRVPEKIHEHLLEPPHVADERGVGNGGQLDLDLVARGQGNDRFDDSAKERLRIDRLEIECGPPAGNPSRNRADRRRASPAAMRFDGWLRPPEGRRPHRRTPCAASTPIRESRSAACGARGRRSTRTRPSACWPPPLPSARVPPARTGARDRAPACSAVRPR